MRKLYFLAGVMCFGPVCALGFLLTQLYRGDVPTFDKALYQTLGWVLVAGPMWGAGMGMWADWKTKDKKQ